MFNLFTRKEPIICPRCMLSNAIDASKPQTTICRCGYRIPLAYIRDYKEALPVFIQLFGWSRAGKTTYLDVLRLHLYDMSRIWNKYSIQPITQIDQDHKATLLTERKNGKATSSTKKKERDQNEVYIMYLDQMERWQSRFLVMMDHAGEMFERMDNFPMKEIPFLQHTPTTFMLVSLADLVNQGKRVDDLLNVYITALEQADVNFNKARRRLIIVLTKGDRILHIPSHINEYLMSDSLWNTINSKGQQESLAGVRLAEYVERMGRVSNAIEKWIADDVDGGNNMLRLIERKRIDARFSIISSTGQDLVGNDGGAQLSPRRVLDPFFWALEFQSK